MIIRIGAAHYDARMHKHGAVQNITKANLPAVIKLMQLAIRRK